MKTMEATALAREEIKLVSGKSAEAIVSCDRQEGIWSIVVEVVETKARIETNDVIAVYELIIDDESRDTIRYKRLRRYARCAAADTSAA